MTCVKLLTKEELEEAKRDSTSGDSAQADWLETWADRFFGHIAALEHEAAKVPELARVAEAHGWNGVDNAKHLATFLEDELGALAKLRAQQAPPTPEEVARDAELVRKAVMAAKVYARTEADLALSRLAAQAARVPGLEDDLANAREDVATNQRVIAEEVEKRMQAEAERDAARGKAEASMGLLAAAGFADADLDARVRRVVEHLQKARAEIDRVKQACVKLDSEKLALQIQAEGKQFLELALRREQSGAATLRERVATLEDSLREEKAIHSNAQSLLKVRTDRADTAEARVQELEAAIRAKADDYRASQGEDAEGPHPLVDWADRVLRGASHPAPSPGAEHDAGTPCARCGHRRCDHNLTTDTMTWRCVLPGSPPFVPVDASNYLNGVTTDTAPAPTPPPGLLEAVEPFLPLMRERAGQRLDSHAQAHLSALHAQDVEVGHVRALLAAYDAAKGGEHPDTVAARANFNDLRRALEMATLGSHVGDTETAMGEKTVQAVRALHEDAAKYRAAVEWAKPDGGHLEDIVNIMREGEVGFVGRLLNRVLGLTLDTPPSGPGGGERVNACGFAPKTKEDVAAFGELVQATARHMETRIAPMPTPEVPQLIEGPVDEPPATPELHAEHCTPDECKYGEGRACTMWHDPALEGMPPQRVVLESGGVQVVEDGSVTLASGTTEWWALGVLGNALAEAKRETAHAQDLLDVAGHATVKAVRRATELGAEDMRERMARVAENVGLKNLASVIRAAPLLGKAVRRG